MARLALAVVVVLLLPLAAGAGSLATPADVVVTDKAVAPAEAATATGGSVAWHNLGSRPHRIAGLTGHWPSKPFTLTRGGTRSVRFRQAGRYEYRVDGRLRAAILVGASAAGTVWMGTVRSSGSLPVPGNPCHDAFLTTLTLTVSSRGTVVGTGKAEAIVPPTCVKQPPQPPPLKSAGILVVGTLDRSAFRLKLFPLSLVGALDGGFFANWVGPGGVDPPTQVIPLRSPSLAQGTVTVTDSSRYKAGTSRNVWQLRRSSG